MSFRESDEDDASRVGQEGAGYELEESLRGPLADAIEKLAREAEARQRELFKRLKVEVRERGAYRLEPSDRITLRDIAQRLEGEETVELRRSEQIAISDVADRAADVELGGSSRGPGA